MHESFTLTSILIDEEKSFKNQKKGVAEIRMMLWYGFILRVQYISEFFAMLNPITIVLICVFYSAYKLCMYLYNHFGRFVLTTTFTCTIRFRGYSPNKPTRHQSSSVSSVTTMSLCE